MDARTFEPDEPLPRTCKHCAHLKTCEPECAASGFVCANPARTSHISRVGLWEFSGNIVIETTPDNTCDQWEEKA